MPPPPVRDDPPSDSEWSDNDSESDILDSEEEYVPAKHMIRHSQMSTGEGKILITFIIIFK